MIEEKIKSKFDSLDSKTFNEFILAVDYCLSNDTSNKMYSLIKDITDDVKSKNQISFKQFRAMYFFFVNHMEKKEKNNLVKTF